MAKTNRIVFQNANGTDYFIVAGDDRRALLRGINYGVYVIARDLDWIHMCWGGGSYFGADEFGEAAEAFLKGGQG